MWGGFGLDRNNLPPSFGPTEGGNSRHTTSKAPEDDAARRRSGEAQTLGIEGCCGLERRHRGLAGRAACFCRFKPSHSAGHHPSCTSIEGDRRGRRRAGGRGRIVGAGLSFLRARPCRGGGGLQCEDDWPHEEIGEARVARDAGLRGTRRRQRTLAFSLRLKSPSGGWNRCFFVF